MNILYLKFFIINIFISLKIFGIEISSWQKSKYSKFAYSHGNIVKIYPKNSEIEFKIVKSKLHCLDACLNHLNCELIIYIENNECYLYDNDHYTFAYGSKTSKSRIWYIDKLKSVDSKTLGNKLSEKCKKCSKQEKCFLYKNSIECRKNCPSQFYYDSITNYCYYKSNFNNRCKYFEMLKKCKEEHPKATSLYFKTLHDFRRIVKSINLGMFSSYWIGVRYEKNTNPIWEKNGLKSSFFYFKKPVKYKEYIKINDDGYWASDKSSGLNHYMCQLKPYSPKL